MDKKNKSAFVIRLVGISILSEALFLAKTIALFTSMIIA